MYGKVQKTAVKMNEHLSDEKGILSLEKYLNKFVESTRGNLDIP